MGLEDDLDQRRKDFFKHLGISDDGDERGHLEHEGHHLVFETDTTIGPNYEDGPRIMIVGSDPHNCPDRFSTGEMNYWIDGKDGTPAPYIFDELDNTHATGTYLTVLCALAHELGGPYQEAWDDLQEFNLHFNGDDFQDYEGSLPRENGADPVMAYAAFTNLHKFADTEKAESADTGYTEWVDRDAELDYLADEIEQARPDLLVLQGKPRVVDALEQRVSNFDEITVVPVKHPSSYGYGETEDGSNHAGDVFEPIASALE